MNKLLFNLATLPEDDEFLDCLAPSVVRKIFFNIDKKAGGVKKEIEKAERIRTKYFESK